jgi:hypothetical protein
MPQPAEKYTITTVTSIEEVEKIRDIWEGMQNHPNSDIDHYLNLMKARSNIIRPHVILVSENGNPVSMAIGRIERLSFDLKLGYKKIYSPTIRSFTVIYGGLLGLQSPELSEVLFREIMNPLKNGQADLVRFNYLAMDSYLYRLVDTRPGFFSRDRFPVVNTHWRMTVPPTIDDFYKSRSSKHRSWLRRMERLLVKDYPEEVKYACYKTGGELDQVFTDAETIAKKTYQRDIKVGFVDNEETRKVYALLVKKGRLRAYFTYIRNEPSAFWIGELYGNTFTLFSTGYEPVFRKYELGTVLFLKMLEDLCTLGVVQYLDFGFGDASYKSRFGDQSRQEAIVNIFSKNVNGLKINIPRLLIVGSQRGALKFLKRFNLLEKIKRIWRKQLKKNPGENAGMDGRNT